MRGFASALLVLAAVPLRAEVTPSFPAAAELVTVDVVVTDQKGQPLPGLTADRFRISEDGREQEIVQFLPVQVAAPHAGTPAAAVRQAVSTNTNTVAAKRTFALVFDDVHLTTPSIARARDVLRDVLTSVVGAEDRVTLVSTGGEVWWTTSGARARADLLDLVARLQGHRPVDASAAHITDYEAERIHARDNAVTAMVTRRFADLGVIQELIPSKEGTARMKDMGLTDQPSGMVQAQADAAWEAANERRNRTLATLQRLVQSMAGTEGRKAVMLVSEGFRIEPGRNDYRELMSAARRANAAVYFLDARGGTQDAMAGAADSIRILSDSQKDAGEHYSFDAERREAEGAASVAVDTGGYAVGPTADLKAAVRRIGDESRTYYLVAYRPPSPTDGQWHKIKFEVSGEGLSVQARRGYLAAGATAHAAKKAKGNDPPPDVRAALDAPADLPQSPLRLAAYVREEEGGRVGVLLVGETDMTGTSALEYTLTCRSRDRNEEARVTDHVTRPAAGAPLVTRRVQLSDGVWQARLVVKDPASGRLGAVTHEFVVPATRRFRMTTPVLTDRVEAGPRPVPVAHRSFAPGTAVVAQVEWLGAKAGADGAVRVRSGFSLDGPRGIVAQTEPTEVRPGADGRLARMMRLPVPAAAGRYVLTLFARDDVAGEDVQSSESFDVVD